VINAVWISIFDPVEIFSKSSPIRLRFWIAESSWIAIRKPDHVQHWSGPEVGPDPVTSEISFLLNFWLHTSVEHDPVSGSRSNRILQFRTGFGFWKEHNRIRYGYPICIDHCSIMFNQRVFRIQTGLDQIFGQVYRIRIGSDYSVKILDWIRIAKISDLFNTTSQHARSNILTTKYADKTDYSDLGIRV